MRDRCLPKRLWLPCPEDQLSGELDRLCAWLRRQSVPYGYLSMQAPLITNLSVMENLWLPQAWITGGSRRAMFHRLRALLDGIEPALAAATAVSDAWSWLGRRPSELSIVEMELVVVLRAALGNPRVVVLDPGWSNLGGVMTLLEPASWWRPGPDPDPLMRQLGWIRMELDAAYGLLV